MSLSFGGVGCGDSENSDLGTGWCVNFAIKSLYCEREKNSDWGYLVVCFSN